MNEQLGECEKKKKQRFSDPMGGRTILVLSFRNVYTKIATLCDLKAATGHPKG